MNAPVITLIGGPTALIEAGGFRVLTDPTFDGPGDYTLPYTTLTKTSGPAIDSGTIGAVDAVVLSHDQHFDNFDRGGRDFALRSSLLLTTVAGAKRLGHAAEGLAPWQGQEIAKAGGRTMRITATPARHGPAGIEPMSGDVIGFVLEFTDGTPAIYVTGDTTWFDGIAEVAHRFRVGIVMPFGGAARTRGPFNLTMSTNDIIETTHAFPAAAIVPLHLDGWAHLTQNVADIAQSFEALGIGEKLTLLRPGVATRIETKAA